jgi:hypothetical protein
VPLAAPLGRIVLDFVITDTSLACQGAAKTVLKISDESPSSRNFFEAIATMRSSVFAFFSFAVHVDHPQKHLQPSPDEMNQRGARSREAGDHQQKAYCWNRDRPERHRPGFTSRVLSLGRARLG